MTNDGDPAARELAVVPGFSATEAVSYGWRKYGENFGAITVASLLLGVVTVGVGLLTREATDIWAIATAATSFVGFIIAGAMIRGVLDITEGYRFELVEAFRRLAFIHVVATSLFAAALTTLALAVLALLGIVIILLVLFTLYFVVDRRTNTFEAISDSLFLIRDNGGHITYLILLSIVVVLVGLLAACAGLFVALPVLAITWAYAYKVLRGQPVAP